MDLMSPSNLPLVTVYTDGSCYPNPGPGGWAAVIRHGENGYHEYSGYEEKTTNNRMEILAAVMALDLLQALPKRCRVWIHSDSQYLVNTMTKGWSRKNNGDLWERMDVLIGKHEVSWFWVRGHDGCPDNELADVLAGRARKKEF